ncbi:hypothetical protein ACQ4PT_032284 [Festuca glaucescens]
MDTVHGRRSQRSSPDLISSRPHQPYAGSSSRPRPRLRWLMLDTVLRRLRRQRSSLIAKPFHPHQPHASDSSDPHQLCSRKSSSSSHLGGLMLDQFVHRTKGDGDEVVGDGVLDKTLSEISFTCTGKPIRVSLRVAEPPGVSRLYLHCPEGFRPELRELNEPSVVAAHGDSILFTVFVPLENCFPYYYPVDYFVYMASRSEKPPSLTQLPPCFIGGQTEKKWDNHYWPYRRQQQRMMFNADIGLMCRGNGKFTVAELSYSGELCLLHYVPGEKNLKWEIKNLEMPYDEGVPNLLCGSWQTDTVIPFGDCYLCWVDNYLGLLFVDVLDKHLDLALYVPLPAALDPKRLHNDLGAADPARRVCVSGTIKLISVSNRSGRSVHDNSNSSFIIRIWRLINIEQVEWEEVAVIKQSQFWNVLHIDSRLPHCRPEFPVLSLVDPDVIFFQLQDSCNIFWLVEIDMKKNKLGAVTLYIDDEEEGRAADDTARRNVFYGHSFMLSQFTQYMDKHAIKSLEYSKKIEKAKLERALEER